MKIKLFTTGKIQRGTETTNNTHPTPPKLGCRQDLDGGHYVQRVCHGPALPFSLLFTLLCGESPGPSPRTALRMLRTALRLEQGSRD